MALIKCPECGNAVSDSAYDCPKCGKHLRKPKRSFFGKICVILFILFNLIMLIALFGPTHSIDYAKMSEAERAGAIVGHGIGITMLLIIWAAGDIITGFLVLFTRPKR